MPIPSHWSSVHTLPSSVHPVPAALYPFEGHAPLAPVQLSATSHSPAEARLFSGNAPDQPVIRLTMRGDPGNLDAHTRLNRIYLPHIIAPKGTQGPFGLTQYDFAENSGYDGNDLFAGESAGGLALFMCERASADFASPNCLAVDRPLARNLSFSYRFKRAYLARWREMDHGVEKLIAKFRAS